MDGRLLVLCEEDVTLNSYNQRVDKDGNILRKRENGSYENKNLKEVQVDENKNVVSAIDLILPVEPESIQHRDILFVDWKTIVPGEIEYLQKLIYYSMTIEQLPLEVLQEGLKQKDSLMKRAHEETFHAIQDERPSIDYRFIAMDHFMRSLYAMMEKQGIVKVLPCYSLNTQPEVRMARQRILNTFRDRNKMYSKNGKESEIKIIESIEYEEFEQIYIRAQDEMLKILSESDRYDTPSSGTEIGE